MKYRHYRMDWTQYNNLGGVTVAWDENYAGISICSEKDNFCKKTGRENARARALVAQLRSATSIGDFVICAPRDKHFKSHELKCLYTDALLFCLSLASNSSRMDASVIKR